MISTSEKDRSFFLIHCSTSGCRIFRSCIVRPFSMHLATVRSGLLHMSSQLRVLLGCIQLCSLQLCRGVSCMYEGVVCVPVSRQVDCCCIPACGVCVPWHWIGVLWDITMLLSEFMSAEGSCAFVCVCVYVELQNLYSSVGRKLLIATPCFLQCYSWILKLAKFMKD